MDERANPLSGRLIIGLMLVALGVLWTLDNLGLANAGRILEWWPVLVLAVGVMKLTGFGMERQTGFGAFLTIAGTLLLLGQLNYVHVGFGILWPLLIIFMGSRVVWRALRGSNDRGPAGGAADTGDYVRSFAVMSGLARANQSQAFRGGELTAVMGGIQLDLTGARPADGRAVLDVFAMWGGIEIRVPQDWRVEIEATPIMGGIESTALMPPGVEPAGTLVVRGFVMMGGVEVKNRPLGDQNRVGVIVRTRRDGDRVTRKEVRIEKGVITVTRETGQQDPPAAPPPMDPQ
jgi:predicted membrane protein